jgi:hypothetical protein
MLWQMPFMVEAQDFDILKSPGYEDNPFQS